MRGILVVGDSMLDRYWDGVVERISPEAPVPVLQVTREFCRPGGAANVAANIATLGGDVSLLTLMGRDEAGRKLRDMLADVEVRGIGEKTTQKIRCVARHQQMLRTDFDESPTESDLRSLGDAYRVARKAGSVVVFSDYAKGALRDVRRMIEAASDCLTLVDPKGTDFERYDGAFLLKPNEAEVCAVIGKYSDAKCDELRRSLRLTHLLVTRGERGMVDFSDDGIYSIRDTARDVFDVSGAGDTVLAVMAHELANGTEYRKAMRLANKAAGIVVGKFGTATVTREELAEC